MKLETAQLLSDKAQQIGVYAELRERYSGRGMSGRETAGVVVEDRDDIANLAIMVVADMEDGADKDNFIANIANRRWDNMGKGYICY